MATQQPSYHNIYNNKEGGNDIMIKGSTTIETTCYNSMEGSRVGYKRLVSEAESI
ncbi:MAG: hypothetical protein M0P49_07470 [Bacilli bacterium]|nr:hypothetical protein [Bacilli bacterium]